MQHWEQAEIAYQCLCHPPVISYTILLGMGWSDLYCASLWLPAPVCSLRIFFPTPRRFILRLETSKAFLCCQRCSLAHHLAYPAYCCLPYKIMEVVMWLKLILGEFWSHLHLCKSEVVFLVVIFVAGLAKGETTWSPQGEKLGVLC